MAAPKPVPTGIIGLDEILNGGVPPATALLLYGEPLCGKKPLLMQFVYEGLKTGVPGIFVLTDFGFAEWKQMMEGSGWKLDKFEENGMLQVIDCYSRQYDPTLEDEGIVVYVNGPSDLLGISMQLSSLQEEIAKVSKAHRFGFHSLSTLFETNDTESVFRFMQFITGKCRQAGAISMYVLERGMHEEKQVFTVEHLMNGVLEFSEDKVHVRGVRNAPSSWYHYDITDTGVHIQKSVKLY